MDQGGGKRKGAFAMYLEPWHADVFDFIELRKNHGKEEVRCSIPICCALGLMQVKLALSSAGSSTTCLPFKATLVLSICGLQWEDC